MSRFLHVVFCFSFIPAYLSTKNSRRERNKTISLLAPLLCLGYRGNSFCFFLIRFPFSKFCLVLCWVTRTNTGHCCVRLDDSGFLFWQVAVVNRSQAAVMDSNSFRVVPSRAMRDAVCACAKAFTQVGKQKKKSGERATKLYNGWASQRWWIPTRTPCFELQIAPFEKRQLNRQAGQESGRYNTSRKNKCSNNIRPRK